MSRNEVNDGIIDEKNERIERKIEELKEKIEKSEWKRGTLSEIDAPVWNKCRVTSSVSELLLLLLVGITVLFL